MEASATSGPLIGVASLARMLAGPRPPVLLDVRWKLGGPPGIGAFRAGHLPGAVFIDLDQDLSGPPGRGGRHPLPGAEAFGAAMRRAGVMADGPVVAYDQADAMSASRCWWLLRYFGHTSVRVLDGGYHAWAVAGERTATGDGPAPAPGDFTARPGGMPLLDAAGSAALARHGVLLDARAAERYRGEVEPLDPVAGHIPGAVSAPTSGNAGPDGRFLAPAALRDRFAGFGVTPGRARPAGQGAGGAAVGSYCGSGVTAAHEVLALAIAGIPAGLYVGSWSEWVTDPARPVATGPEPG